MLFGRFGLEIGDEECAHTREHAPKIMLMKSELLGAPDSIEPLLIINPEKGPSPAAEDEAAKDLDRTELLVLFQPKSESSPVDVIARWADDQNYALLARQGNCVLIGVESPANRWSKGFVRLVDEACMALRRRPAEKFSVFNRELAQPGTYEFELDVSHSTERLFQKRFFFQFDRPTRLTARLEHKGSKSVCLSFYGRAGEETIAKRSDAMQGENLELMQEIDATQVAELKNRSCQLSVCNFDESNAVKCKLVITVEPL